MQLSLTAFSRLSYLQKSWLLILFFTGLRIILLNVAELGNDESYYWTYSQHLQWNYFDHPPMVAIWIRIFTLNLWLQDHVFFIRLGSLAGCAISCYFIYKTIANLSTEKAGFIGVLLYNTSLYGSITSGLFIMPDTPQMVFWTGSMYLVTQILKNEMKWLPWILFGIASGLCIMSKVHGVSLWCGVFLYSLLYARRWFLLPQFYIAALITAIVISPILLWNIQNDFITYRFHSNRVIVHNNNLHWFGLLKEIIGELIINNPFNVALICWMIFKKDTSNAVPAFRIYKLMATPLLLIILAIALFRQALPHWSGPIYITLIPIAAIGLVKMSRVRYQSILKYSIGYTCIAIVVIIAAVQFYPGTLGNKTGEDLGRGDITLDAYGWQQAGEKFANIYNRADGNDGAFKAPLVCNTWWGAHQEYFFARPVQTKMIGLGPLNDLHNYQWKNTKVLNKIKMDTAFCIVHSVDFYDAKKAYADYYHTIDSVTTIEIFRNKKPAHRFYVYRLSGWKHQALSISPLTNSISTLILSGVKSNFSPAVSKSCGKVLVPPNASALQ